MFHILYKYLILNKQLSIPGIGHFYVEQEPATLDMAGQVIHSPLPVIKFTNTVTTADKNFFEFASRELHIEQWDTIRQFHDFSYKLKNDVNKHTRIELPGMGLLRRNNLGGLSFEPAMVLHEYFPEVNVDEPLEEETRDSFLTEEKTIAHIDPPDNEDDTPMKTDRWWVAAIVLGIVGIAAIVFYYYKNSHR